MTSEKLSQIHKLLMVGIWEDEIQKQNHIFILYKGKMKSGDFSSDFLFQSRVTT